MIYIEPNEVTSKQFPPGLAKHGEELPHLEAMTGGDFLVTAYESPIGDLGDEDNPEPERRLKEACAKGNLIQRKHGLDLTASIVDKRLFHAGLRMGRWTAPYRAWLVVIGCISESNNKAVIGGQASGLRYTAVIGALDWWSDPHGSVGGAVTILDSPDKLESWTLGMERRLKAAAKKPKSDPEPVYKPPDRTFYDPQWAWLATLETLPGIGPKRAKILGQHFGDLATALHWMSRPDLYKENRGNYPKGISLPMIIKIHKYLQLGHRELFDTGG